MVGMTSQASPVRLTLIDTGTPKMPHRDRMTFLAARIALARVANVSPLAVILPPLTMCQT